MKALFFSLRGGQMLSGKFHYFFFEPFPYRHLLFYEDFPQIDCSTLFEFQEQHWEVHKLSCSKTQKYMQNTSHYMYHTEEMPAKSILQDIKKCNAKETIEAGSGWARTYSPTLVNCPKCNIILSPVTKKWSKDSANPSLLITMDHILEIDIYTKQCKMCFLIIKPETSRIGLLNIGDLYLVSWDIFLTLQNTIRWV